MFKKRTGALLLAAVMAAGTMATTALAAQPQSISTLESSYQGGSPYWLEIRTATVSLSASGTTLKPRVVVTAVESSADIDGTLYLEQKSGGDWSEVDSWSISGTGRLSESGTYTGAESGTYRSRAVVTVGSETIEVVSASKTI